ncbi:MAG: HD domain-containing protein [Erysipelotrichaceae bacterium]|nr:HD domain-containing protein [Erysipelotrichaceae bacterium]
MESYYYNSSTVLKYLRKVLNEINSEYVDNGIKTGFIMKRFAEKYKFNSDKAAKLVLLCILKDIGSFYQDGIIPKDNDALAAASSYTFLKHCSPLGDAAKPLLFYKALYMPDIDNDDYYCGLLITLIDQVVKYIYEKLTINQIERRLVTDTTGKYHPDQIKKIIKLLRDDYIIDKLAEQNSLFVHETCSFVQNANYTDEELLSYIDTTNFSFEFHNHETLGHTVTTAAIARELAKLIRLSENQVNVVYLAALLHDIGKIKIPVSILCHPGRLTLDEFQIMKKHVDYTAQIVEGSFSYKIVEAAASHHERLDGSGYPKGLKDRDLSIGAKIVSVADVASALYCKRSYKEEFPQDKIIEILTNEANNNKLDKRIVDRFIDYIDTIMDVAREKEAEVLKKYEDMKSEYEVLSESEQLHRFFERGESYSN